MPRLGLPRRAPHARHRKNFSETTVTIYKLPLCQNLTMKKERSALVQYLNSYTDLCNDSDTDPIIHTIKTYPMNNECM
jgi:hypothetical protein